MDLGRLMSDTVVAELSVICAGCTIPQRQFIAETTKVLKECGLKLDLHALGTDIEGPLDKILVAVKYIRTRCHEMGAPKVEIHLNISSRTEPLSLEDRKSKVLGAI